MGRQEREKEERERRKRDEKERRQKHKRKQQRRERRKQQRRERERQAVSSVGFAESQPEFERVYWASTKATSGHGAQCAWFGGI